jgi:FkbM family methyltransferase
LGEISAAAGRRERLDSLGALRGLVVIVMALPRSVAAVLLACSAFVTFGSCGEKSTDGCPPSVFEGGSYHSQAYEDYILSYVFRGLETGTYVDVGANDPEHFSVTKYFYDRGWTGLNIDANPQFRDRYREHRPRDTNLIVGIAEEAGSLTLYKISDAPGLDEFEVSGLSTFDAAIAEEHRRRGFRVRRVRVPVERLDAVLARHPIEDITFLNVDVEGFERSVLASVDFDAARPRVAVIEATYPLTRTLVHDQWENILIENGYVFAMSDGLNRYYVDRDHSELLPRFESIDRCVHESQARRGQ